jgi:hypothetical protein
MKSSSGPLNVGDSGAIDSGGGVGEGAGGGRREAAALGPLGEASVEERGISINYFYFLLTYTI